MTLSLWKVKFKLNQWAYPLLRLNHSSMRMWKCTLVRSNVHSACGILVKLCSEGVAKYCSYFSHTACYIILSDGN